MGSPLPLPMQLVAMVGPSMSNQSLMPVLLNLKHNNLVSKKSIYRVFFTVHPPWYKNVSPYPRKSRLTNVFSDTIDYYYQKPVYSCCCCRPQSCHRILPLAEPAIYLWLWYNWDSFTISAIKRRFIQSSCNLLFVNKGCPQSCQAGS